MAPVMIPALTTPTSATTPDPMSDRRTTGTIDLAAIATTVEHRGVAAVDPRHIESLVSRARAAGASTVLLDVLQGSSEPPVARLRAFARIAAVLVSGRDDEPAAAEIRGAVPQPR